MISPRTAFCIIRQNLHARCGSIPADFLVSYPQPPLTCASQMKLNQIKDTDVKRIHQKLTSEQKPGLANFLKASKYYYFDRYVQKMTAKQIAKKVDHLAVTRFNRRNIIIL